MMLILDECLRLISLNPTIQDIVITATSPPSVLRNDRKYKLRLTTLGWEVSPRSAVRRSLGSVEINIRVRAEGERGSAAKEMTKLL